MTKQFDMGIAGSIIVSLLIIATVLLLRSFYKHYSKVQKSKDE